MPLPSSHSARARPSLVPPKTRAFKSLTPLHVAARRDHVAVYHGSLAVADVHRREHVDVGAAAQLSEAEYAVCLPAAAYVLHIAAHRADPFFSSIISHFASPFLAVDDNC